MPTPTTEKIAAPPQRFGTFLGVYVPSVLTILGLVMYLRFGWVVGNVGLPFAILIVLLASSITLITALGASAVATNMRVRAGGEYYLISHSLGLELGGAVGIPLFLCRTLSITFYSFGLAESVVALWPDKVEPHQVQLLAAAIIVAITAVAGRSASLALKVQVPILVAVGLSFAALALGVLLGEWRAPEWTPSYRTAPEGFWYVFAVFFPAVTGFAAGIGMSGDLEDPQRSIPRGTLWAVATGTLCYLLIPLLLSVTAVVSRAALAEPGIIWVDIAVLGAWLIFPGIWGAILSSALGSALTGPRVLQALAMDGIAPRFLARLSRTGQPTVATWFSGGLALLAVALGGLNAVAQFVTILFLTFYVSINLAAGLEQLVGDLSYRPTINVPWYVSFLGAAGATAVMFLISPYACIVAIVFETGLYLYLRHRALARHWGDVRAGFWAALARVALLRLRDHRRDPRNWRPLILVFVGDPQKRVELVRLASWFSQDRGLVTASQLVVGDLEQSEGDVGALEREMDEVFAEERLVAFAEVHVVSDFVSGAIDVAQANGLAGLRANTVLFGWAEKEDRLASELRIMRALAAVGKNTIIARTQPAFGPVLRIDLWWRGKQRNGDLMLLLAYLLNLNPEWQQASIVVRSIVADERECGAMTENLHAMLRDVRIQAGVEVIIKPQERGISELIYEYSRGADVVFFGLRDTEPGTEADYAEQLRRMSDGLQTAIFVRNAGEFAGKLI